MISPLTAIILLLLSALAAMAAPAATLQQRIARAAPGAVIRVAPGIHRVNLHIDRPVTLIGAPGAVLNGGGRGDVIRIAASHVTISHLGIRDSGADLTAMNAGIYIEQHTHDITISGNRLDDVLFGVYLDGPADVRLLGNRIRGKMRLRSPDRGDGIHLWNDTGILIAGNDIADTRDGIYIYVSNHDNRIVDNRIHDLRYGIHYMYSNHNAIVHNHTYRTVAGYALMQSDHLKVRANRSDDDSEYGILMNYVTYSDIGGNIIRDVQAGPHPAIIGGAGKGMFVYNSEFNRIHGNRIVHCPIGIHLTAGSDHNVIYGNAFIANRRQVKYVQNQQQEWSWHRRGNYWSDYLGWDLNGDARGDIPYRPNDGVDVLLWKYPSARLLMNSPAVLVLRYVQRAFPVFMPPGVTDSHPLMRPPPAVAGDRHVVARY